MEGTIPFEVFFLSNSVVLFTSLAIVVVQVTLVRERIKSEMRVLKVINKMMWLASIYTTVAFISTLSSLYLSTSTTLRGKPQRMPMPLWGLT